MLERELKSEAAARASIVMFPGSHVERVKRRNDLSSECS
jgi:hypothetical protein